LFLNSAFANTSRVQIALALEQQAEMAGQT